MLKRIATLFLFITTMSQPCFIEAKSNQSFEVGGAGGYPLSPELTSMWLLTPDGVPLLMAYFHGPEGWHNVEWHTEASFKKGDPSWAEFKSKTTTLRLWLDPNK